MPQYNYHCKNCNKNISVELKISEAPLKKCIKCGEENCLERIWDKGVPYINKSGGFYSNSNV